MHTNVAFSMVLVSEFSRPAGRISGWIILFAGLLLTAGCTAPAVISATPDLAVIGDVKGNELPVAERIAEKHCRQYRKDAVFLAERSKLERAVFQCVATD